LQTQYYRIAHATANNYQNAALSLKINLP